MPTCYLAPDPIQSTQFIPGGNTPANGGQLFFYASGTSTKQTVYKDPAGATAWSNPIVLDSGGNLPSGGEVWFLSGLTYKVVFAPASDSDPPTSPYWTKDDLTGINDVASQIGLEWFASPTAIYLSATSFSMSGDQTSSGAADLGRRMKFTVSAGDLYARIIARNFASGSTSVGIVQEGGAASLDNGLTAAYYGFLSATNPSYPVLSGGRALAMDPTDRTKLVTLDVSGVQTSTVVTMYAATAGVIEGKLGTSIAAASTLALDSVNGDYLHVTGAATTITGITLSAGRARTLIFDGQYTLAYNATSIITPGAVSINTESSDVAIVRGEGSGVARIVSYQGPGANDSKFALISSITPSHSTQIVTFTGLAGYRVYKAVIEGPLFPLSSGVKLCMQTSPDGSSWISSSAYQTAFLGRALVGLTNYDEAIQATSFIFTNSTATIQSPSAATGGFAGEISMYNFNNGTTRSNILFSANYMATNASQIFVSGGGVNNSTSAGSLTAVRFFFSGSSSYISSGTFSLYGLRT